MEQTIADRVSIKSTNGGWMPGAAKRTYDAMLTPEIAEYMLSHNKVNRAISPARVRALVADIRAGNWLETNDAICFDWNLQTINGQHRATAVKETGRSVPVTIKEGMDPEAFKAMDRGRGRTVADTLQARNFKNAKLLAATLAMVNSIRAGFARENADGLTIGQAEEMLEREPEIARFVLHEYTHWRAIPGRILCSLRYLTSRVSPKESETFFDGLVRGVNIDTDDPVWHVRDRAMKNMAAKVRVRPQDYTYMIIRAWNATRQGESWGDRNVGAIGKVLSRTRTSVSRKTGKRRVIRGYPNII